MDIPLPWLFAGTAVGLALAVAGRTLQRRSAARHRHDDVPTMSTALSTAMSSVLDASSIAPSTVQSVLPRPGSRASRTGSTPATPSRPPRSRLEPSRAARAPRSQDPARIAARAAAREKAARVIAAEAARVLAARQAQATVPVPGPALSARSTPVVDVRPDEAETVVPVISESPTPHVLVVDDSITIRRKTGSLLKRHGYRVTYAVDGMEALLRCASDLPDAVVTDIEMPRLDGISLVKRLRAEPRTAGLPIVMVSSAEARYREEALATGVDALLAKPWVDDALLAPLTGLHEIARQRRA